MTSHIRKAAEGFHTHPVVPYYPTGPTMRGQSKVTLTIFTALTEALMAEGLLLEDTNRTPSQGRPHDDVLDEVRFTAPPNRARKASERIAQERGNDSISFLASQRHIFRSQRGSVGRARADERNDTDLFLGTGCSNDCKSAGLDPQRTRDALFPQGQGDPNEDAETSSEGSTILSPWCLVVKLWTSSGGGASATSSLVTSPMTPKCGGE